MVTSGIETRSLYRPRDPQASDLWRLLDEHFASFQQVYDERYQAKYGYWRPIVDGGLPEVRRPAGRVRPRSLPRL